MIHILLYSLPFFLSMGSGETFSKVSPEGVSTVDYLLYRIAGRTLAIHPIDVVPEDNEGGSPAILHADELTEASVCLLLSEPFPIGTMNDIKRVAITHTPRVFWVTHNVSN